MEGSTVDPAAEEPVIGTDDDAAAGVEATSEEAPKGRRSAAKADAAAAEEKPKRRIARPRAKAAAEASSTEEDAAVEEAPKPRRTRAKAAPAEAASETVSEQDPPAEEAPKPRRTRARAAADPEQPAAAEPRRPRVRPTRPSLRRGRGKSEATREDVLVYATARYVRSSARKARMVCNHIRGKTVPEARAILAFAPRGVAKDWSKLLNSAVANAEHNYELIGDELRVKEAYADEGPTLKRFKPRAMGRATPIHKKTSHLSITLTPED
jgi:ribosomal protein L22